MKITSNVPDIQRAIDYFTNGHEKMRSTISQLSDEQMENEFVLESWTTKDILSHIAAWSAEAVLEIDRILEDKATWHKLYPTNNDTENFNEEAVQRRRNSSIKDVISEWDRNFMTEIYRISQLTDKEWERQSENDIWPEEGNPVTPSSLYHYAYHGEQHEAGHATQIQAHFHLV